MSEFDKQMIGEILSGHGDWFTAQLLRLIAKADENNRQRLDLGFPNEVKAANEYQGIYLDMCK